MFLCNAINRRLQVLPFQSRRVSWVDFSERKDGSAKLLHLYWPNLPSQVRISSFVRSTSLLSSKLPFSHCLLFIGQNRVKLQSCPWIFPFLSVAFFPHPLILFFIYLTFSGCLLIRQVEKLLKNTPSKAMTKFLFRCTHYFKDKSPINIVTSLISNISRALCFLSSSQSFD